MGEDGDLSVSAFVSYCRTQAGLLSGRVERMTADAEALLDEIDDTMAEVRERLDASGSVDGTASPPSTAGPTDAGVDVEAIEDLESDLESKQTRVAAKQARIQAHQSLAAGYADLAADLRNEVDSGRAAMERVVRFESERDAPAFFPDRQTVVEAAADSDDDT